MKDPDYGNLGDHTETVQIDFDPRRITYAELLAVFWKSHEPGARIWSRQYMNAVFYHNERQQQQAMDSRAAVEQQTGAAVRSALAPLGTFYPAEEYHQKYLLKRRADLAGELYRIYPRAQDFVDSTAVSRLNGYAGGNGTPEQLAREIDLLGLSSKGREALGAMVQGRGRGFWN
jgi:peptide-methionine (S)-S-oxide reductase